MERLEIIETLKHAPDALAASVGGLPESALRYRPADGGWSIKETAGHMRDAAEVWHKRLYSVWSLTDPVFVSYDGEQWVIDRAYQEGDIRATIADFRSQRLKTVDLLSHAVDWTRLGQQPGVGRRTLKQFAAFLVSHDADHLAQIEALKAAAATPAATTT